MCLLLLCRLLPIVSSPQVNIELSGPEVHPPKNLLKKHFIFLLFSLEKAKIYFNFSNEDKR